MKYVTFDDLFHIVKNGYGYYIGSTNDTKELIYENYITTGDILYTTTNNMNRDETKLLRMAKLPRNSNKKSNGLSDIGLVYIICY